jgi:hypothetical protein
MSRTGRTFGALAGAALVLAVANAYDGTFLRDVLRTAQAHFDAGGVGVGIALGSMLVAGSVLLVGVLAWRAASVVVDLVYIVAGGFLVTLPWLVWTFATTINDTPPVLPEPIATFLGNIYFETSGGSLNAVGTIGAAMLIAGVASLVRWSRTRAVSERGPGPIVAATDPPLR